MQKSTDLNFDEIAEEKLTPSQEASFKSLKNQKDFLVFKDYVEKLIIKKTYALLTGTFEEMTKKEDYILELRGFARNWTRIMASLNYEEKTDISN